MQKYNQYIFRVFKLHLWYYSQTRFCVCDILLGPDSLVASGKQTELGRAPASLNNHFNDSFLLKTHSSSLL